MTKKKLIRNERCVRPGMRQSKKAEFGDFQTPPQLARAVCRLLSTRGPRPAALLEPTCGLCSFLRAGLEQFGTVEKAVGADINAEYIRRATEELGRLKTATTIRLERADFFSTDWESIIKELPEPTLVLGNPPWVTNANLGSLGSQNLPTKSNFQGHRGIDAITGKANFDIAEWMLIRLFEAMNGRQGTLAMLCKSSTARKVLNYAWKRRIALGPSSLYFIDANRHFDVAVDAVLLVADFISTCQERQAGVYARLGENKPDKTIGYEDGTLVADVFSYRRWKHLVGESRLKWRSGVKHDCSKIMELYKEGDRYRNGLGELIQLEESYVYPMLKSSNLAKGQTSTNRYMIVPQKSVGEDTAAIEMTAPKTWRYLHSHASLLNKRGSSIYHGRPPFSVFGVGEYSFAPWKVTISGFYKALSFVPVGPWEGKPVVLDDTSYFVPCQTEGQAVYLANLLNDRTAREFFGAFVFWDSKRPITAELLGRLDVRRLAEESGSGNEFRHHFAMQGAEEAAQSGLYAKLDLE